MKPYTVIALLDGLPSTPHVVADDAYQALVESFHKTLGGGYGRDEVKADVDEWWERGAGDCKIIESAELLAVMPGWQVIEMSSHNNLLTPTVPPTPKQLVIDGLKRRGFTQRRSMRTGGSFRRKLEVGHVSVEFRSDDSCNVALYNEDGVLTRLPDDYDRVSKGSGIPFEQVLPLVDKYIGVDPLMLRVYPRINDRVVIDGDERDVPNGKSGICIRANDPKADPQDWDYYARIRLDDGREFDVDVLQDIKLVLYRKGDAVEVQTTDGWVPGVYVESDDQNRPICDAPGRRWEGCDPACVRPKLD